EGDREARVGHDRSGRERPVHRRRRVELFERREMRRARESGGARAGGALPSPADQFRTGPELAGRPRERKRLELARAGVVVQHEGRGHKLRTSAGSESTSVFRSAARSTVVTSVTPFVVTTTRSFTP